MPGRSARRSRAVRSLVTVTTSPIASRMTSRTVSGRGDDRRVIDRVRADPGLHALGHEALVVLNDHAVLLGDQEPGRPVLPQRPLHLDADASRRDRPLDGRQHRQLSFAAFWAKAAAKAASGR